MCCLNDYMFIYKSHSMLVFKLLKPIETLPATKPRTYMAADTVTKRNNHYSYDKAMIVRPRHEGCNHGGRDPDVMVVTIVVATLAWWSQSPMSWLQTP